MTVPTELDRRFRDAAARSGILDAAYDLVASPLGDLLVATGPHGILRIAYEADLEEHVEWLSQVAGRNVIRAPRGVDGVRRELDEYFAGRRQAFDVAVDLRGITPFTERVLLELARVPFGQTATYAELAARAGNPRAARAVGMTMNRNRVPIVLPCHRVIGSDGGLVGYAGGLDRKVALLTLEGVLL